MSSAQEITTRTNASRIWIFDGGGPGVISQLLIINEIMHRIQWDLKLKEVPLPCDYAGMMVGSGLGAVVVVLLSRLRLTAEQALVHITELGQSVFLEPNESGVGPRFNQEVLRSAVVSILKQHGMTESTRMIGDAIISGQTYAAVTSTPISDLSHCRLVRSYPSAESDCTILEGVLSATAIPGWFPSVKVGPTHSKESMVAGAIDFSNPAKQTLHEAKRMFGSNHEASLILSLGSGHRHPQGLQTGVGDEMRQRLDDLAQSGKKTAAELSKRFENSRFYHRFSVDSGLENLSMTGWTEDDIGTITAHTKVYMEQVSSSLSTVAELMVKNKGSVTLGQLTQVDVKSGMAKPIPRLSPFFLERDDVLGFMEQRLVLDSCDTQRLFVIHGMGGSGKTQAASFFVRRNKHRYNHIFFVDASSVESIKADLQSAIRSLGGAHSHDTFEDALRFLIHADNRDWLVIFDNADDPKLRLTTFIPECEHGTIVITGRNVAMANLAPESHWHLRGMSEPDSIHVLFKAARRKDAPNEAESNAVTELAGILGGLPLALVHAGNYCDTSKITFSEYLERFQLYRSKLMTMEPPLQLDKYSYSTYTSIKLSYSLLGEQARGLLHLLAFFHPSSIHLDILRAASKHRYQPDREDMLLPWDDQHDGAVDALRRLLIPDDSWDIYMDLLLNQLQSFSLITVSHSGDHQTITIHTLVQSCVLDTLSLDVFSHYFSMTVLVLSGCSHDEERAIFQHLSVHITELESRKMTIHPNHLSAFAYIMFINGNYEESMRIREKVRDECRRVNGDEDISTLRVSYRIATCHWRLQRLAEAEELIRRVMKAQKRVLGDDNDEVLLSYRLLAHILRDLQQTEEAEKILMRLLALHMIKYGQEHSKTLSTQLSIVTNLHTQKRYSEAEALSRYILPIMTEVLREGDAITLYTSNILSLALMGQEKWAEAGAILSGLVVKTTTLRGKHHPNTLMFQFNHTQYLIYQENLDEAKGILQYIVGVQEKVLGMNHTHTVESRNRLQNVIRAQKARLLSNIIPPRPPSIVNSSLKSTREFVRFNHLWHIFLLLFNPERTPGLEGVEIALEARGLPWSGVLATLAAVAVPFVLLRSLASLFSL